MITQQCPEDYILVRQKSAPDSLWRVMWQAIFQEAAAMSHFHNFLWEAESNPFQSSAQIAGCFRLLHDWILRPEY